jgi:hypothetical protein
MSIATVQKELASLEKLTTGGLRAKYRELFGNEARSSSRQWLFRRCAWRVQALAEGGLPERTRRLRAVGFTRAVADRVHHFPACRAKIAAFSRGH